MMEVKSLKHNFFMYFIRAFSNFGFMLFIFPYITRSIGVEGTGIIQYVESMINYFILFINLGIMNYGKREIALYRNDKIKLSNLVNELLTILCITTFVISLLYILFIKIFISNYCEKKLFYIYFLQILFNIFNLEWFYVGIENQSFITRRTIIVKIISGILIFILVKNKDDIFLYVLILNLANVLSNIYNFIYLKKYIKFRFEEIERIKKHLMPLFYLFFSVLATTIIYNIDTIMIKNIIGNKELGYYTLALKFGHIPLVVGSTVVAVFYPRLSNLIGKGKIQEYTELWNQGINIIFLFYIPGSIYMFLFSEQIILLLGGKEFLPASLVFKFFAIYIIIMGVSTSVGTTLILNKEDKAYSMAIIISSMLNICLNSWLIPKYNTSGAVIATILTQVFSIIFRILLCKNIFKNIKIININLLKILLSALIMSVVILKVSEYLINPISLLLVCGIIGSVIYFLILFMLKETFIYSIVKKVNRKIN